MGRTGIRNTTILYLGILVILSCSCEKATENQVVDIDGNVYSTTTIGTQVWMAENLKTTRLNDGTKIPLVTDDKEWSNLSTPGYCWYGNYEAFFNLNHYGALYNYYSVSSDKLCPTGWHLPNDEEWETLIIFLGKDSAGGKLKETGSTNWASPNTGATNETDFTALPGGFRNTYYNDFQMFRQRAIFWSSSPVSNWELNNYSSDIINSFRSQSDGFSVRCIKN